MTKLTQNSFLYMFISILYIFEHLSAHHRQIQLYQYDIWYMPLWSSGMQVWMLSPNQMVTSIQWHIPDIVLMQLDLLMMSTWMLETC